MKKMISAILAMLLLFGLSASAEEFPETFELPANSWMYLDLDGDGENESVYWDIQVDGEYMDESVKIAVQTWIDDGMHSMEFTSWESDCLYGAKVYAADLDGNGAMELYVTGDEMSDDYCTYILAYFDGTFAQYPVADICRGGENEGYLDYGYGQVTYMGDGLIELTGSQDVLGTYMGSRLLKLENGRFEIADDGLWRFNVDEEVWEYRALTLAQEIDVVFVCDGEETAGTLKPGEKLAITATDKVSMAQFTTEDGLEGYVKIEPDTETGWGHKIGGVPVGELFEYVPYAD